MLGARPWQLALKRLIDVVVASVVLVLLLPLLGLAALLILTTSPGPAIAREERLGRDGRRFRMLRLRATSAYDPEGRATLGAEPTDETDTTPVGRTIRRLGIDGLPQLWNVMKGDMSLVGPRPRGPEESAADGGLERARLAVTPGITCLSRVSIRDESDPGGRADMDLEYIRTWSLRLDLRLLARTVAAVLVGRDIR